MIDSENGPLTALFVQYVPKKCLATFHMQSEHTHTHKLHLVSAYSFIPDLFALFVEINICISYDMCTHM